MSEKDKSGSEANSCEFEGHELMTFEGSLDQRVKRPVEDVLQKFATRAMQMEHDGQKMTIVIFPQYVCISCFIFLPCGYHASMSAYINWPTIQHIKDAEIVQTLNRLLTVTTEDANQHTDKHKGRTEVDHD